MITVAVPSLQRLSLYIPFEGSLVNELVIDTPLKYLELDNHNEERGESHSCVIQNMPELEEAYVVVALSDLQSLIGSITSVKRLTLCSEAVYGDGFVFNQLEHLKLCVCTGNSMELLDRLLEDSPNLQVLDIFDMDHDDSIMCRQRVAIDESLMSSLKNFNWSRYLGRPQRKDLEVYILEERLSLKDHKTAIL